MRLNNWLFEIRNNGNSCERKQGINSLKEFKLKIIYICIYGEVAKGNGEALLSYEDISKLVDKYSAGTIKIARPTMKRLIDELIELGVIVRENDLKGKISKSLYKISGGY